MSASEATPTPSSIDDSTLPQDVVWRRLKEYYDALQPVDAKAEDSTKKEQQKRLRPGSGYRWRVYDAVAVALWLYWFARIFVGDVDESLILAINPSWLPLLEYRFVAYVAVIVAFAAVWPRGRKFLGYVLCFPLVVALWKLPYYLFRHRGWAFLLGILQAGTALFGDLRWNIITKGLAVISAIAILNSSRVPIVAISAAYIAGLMILSLYRRVRRLVGSPSFVTIQQRAIRSAMNSTALNTFLTLGDEYTRHDRRGYSTAQAAQVEMTISNGIALNKLLYLWAHQLDQYRRRHAPAVIFHLLTYAWVYIAAIIAFSLLNLAVLKIDPEQFEITGPRPFLAILVYTLSTFALGSAGGITPVGELAYLLQFAAGLANLLILAGLAANVLLTLLRERDDTATTQLIQELEGAAEAHERRFRGSYALSVDEAYARLRDFGAAATSLAAFVIRAIPRELSRRRDD